jgi:ABC-type multidrug transport system ATPase subunit
LRLFCGFKNIPEAYVEAEVAARLEDVQLTAWADAPSASYSGGMKRRLSVAIALIGSPQIVFLDEVRWDISVTHLLNSVLFS